MISIKRRRQIKATIIISSILIIILAVGLVIGYYPFGLHQKNMKNINMPKDSIIYISAKSINESISKFTSSVYAYRISHDESMYDFSIMIKTIDAFFYNLKNNSNFFIKQFSKILTSRNASILLWKYNNSLSNSELLYFFDVGKINTFLANVFFNLKTVNIGTVKYEIKKEVYNNYKVFGLINDKPLIYFSFYNGIVIISKNYSSIKKIIDFFDARAGSFENISILQNSSLNYNPDISFYINKKLFDDNKCEGSMLFNPIKYFRDVYNIYGNIKLYDDNGKMDIFVDYQYGGSDKFELYNLNKQNNIQNYLPYQNTVVYLSLKSYISGLYPIIYNDLKNDNNTKIKRELLNLFNKMNNKYSFLSIISDLYGEMALAYIESSKIIYPIMIFNIENYDNILPKLENELLKKYINITKSEKKYNNGYIYSYTFPNGSSLYYTFVDKIYFFSENVKAIETAINNINTKNTLNEMTKKIDDYNPNYIFTIQLEKANRILKYFNVPLRNWSYPNNLVIGSSVNSNYTHINISFDANFRKLKNNQ